ncbi:MAG: toxin TcdB middle/N-terminal domain-containing protein, partial [Deltaproteobacteria bacterium]
ISRSSDAHGSTIHYRYRRDRGQLYLSDISYVSPHACAGNAACTEALSGYGARVRFVYEPREDAFTTYTSGYPVTTALRLRRIEVTAYDDETEQRTLVRRYHLRYQTGTFHSLLSEVQVEGRPSTTRTASALGTTLTFAEGVRTIPESGLTDAIVGDLLPAMRFRYSALPAGASGGIPGFGGLSNTVVDIPGSPPSSIDEARSELMDVNSDGLPDLVVTDPARYRTRDGQPGAGVFFNGFAGTDVRPASAGSFSAAVPLGVPAGLDAVMAFSNLNVVPMDIDGDGRQDLLHMPRTRSYGWFTPVRAPDGSTVSISPRDQGWRFAYAQIDLPATDLDPRIDLGRDGQHIEVLDVNNDHLIDVVRTTGTVMQTWLNLGWLPGGDGRFGSYTVSGTGAVTSSSVALSTAPYESCLLQSGTPIDFESSEVRLADMNGDGLQDLVEIQRGRIRYWPGRGVGSFGVGPRRCARGEGANRYIEVASPPRDLPIDLAGVQLADIDGDGASDILAVRFDAIDVWFNRAGSSFTERLIVRGTPAAPGFANRVRFTDIDGSGTIDAVYGNGGDWQFVDLLADASGNALRPRLLVGVENGLGAETSIGYESSVVDYLRDLAEAQTCAGSCESFVWQGSNGPSGSSRLARLTREPAATLLRPGGTPVISTVVRSVTTTDHLERIGATPQSSESRFAYHDGYYEGIEQEFRGFGAADAVVVGDDESQDVLTRTWFHQGRRPANIADDRLTFSPDEALKGREYLTEVFNRAGVFLTTSHATLSTRLLATGLDARPIQYAFVSEMNEIRYDTSPFTPSTEGLSLPSVRREVVSASTGTPGPASPAADPARTIGLRGALRARVRTTYDAVDNLGHVLQQTVYGHVADSGWVGPTDEPVVSVSVPVAVSPGAGRWLWRTRRQYAHGSDTAFLFGDTETVFDPANGDPLHVYTHVSHPSGLPAYVFNGEGFDDGGASAVGAAAQDMASSAQYDAWGNVTATWSGAGTGTVGGPAQQLRRRDVGYDALFHHFPVRETLEATSTVDLVTQVPMPVSGGFGTIIVGKGEPGWDRGLGAIRYALDPNGQRTSMTQDGLGRVTSMTPPLTDRCGATTLTVANTVPATVISYQVTSDGRTQPMSTVHTVQVLHTAECDYTSLGTELATSEAMGFVDGLGRVRATLAQGERDTGAHHWIRSGLTQLDRKGQVLRAYHPSYLADTAVSFGTVVTPGSEVFTTATYDAFGRAIEARAEDLSLTTTSYHAASTTVCDPLDHGSGLHADTCTTSRSDGFGRVIDQILIASTALGT